MKTTQQQIQSHLKKVDVSRFPVVSNEATKELNSVAVNKQSKYARLQKTVNEWTSYEAGASPTILEISWNKWRRKNMTRSWVLGPSPRSQKETEMITSWTPLKSCHWTVFKRKETYYPLGIVHSREFHNPKEIDCRITQDMHLQISSPKTMKSLSLNHRRKKGHPSLIQATRIELLYLK